MNYIEAVHIKEVSIEEVPIPSSDTSTVARKRKLTPMQIYCNTIYSRDGRQCHQFREKRAIHASRIIRCDDLPLFLPFSRELAKLREEDRLEEVDLFCQYVRSRLLNYKGFDGQARILDSRAPHEKPRPIHCIHHIPIDLMRLFRFFGALMQLIIASVQEEEMASVRKYIGNRMDIIKEKQSKVCTLQPLRNEEHIIELTFTLNES